MRSEITTRLRCAPRCALWRLQCHVGRQGSNISRFSCFSSLFLFLSFALQLETLERVELLIIITYSLTKLLLTMSPNSEAPSASHPNELKTVSPDPRNTSSANKARNRQSSNNSWLSNGQLTPISTARAHHHRESSLTSLGSAGPASPYTANTSNQNVPGDFSATPEWGYGGGSKPVPEIDFTLHTMEDSTQVSTMERVHKGKWVSSLAPMSYPNPVHANYFRTESEPGFT